MKLYEAISDALDRFGLEQIKSERFINFLADYRAFEIKPAKTILREFLKAGYGERVYQLDRDGAPGKLLKLKSFGMDLMQSHGFNEIHVNYVLDSICYGLGWVELPPDEISEEQIKAATLERIVQVAGEHITMIAVKGGSFDMGATPEQGIFAAFDEKPSIETTVDDFYICDVPVTQKIWQVVMKDNPSHHKGDSFPVERVTWEECQIFIERLNLMSGFKFRLPTEAEWEYAARGGAKATHTKYAGTDDDTISDYCWCKANSDNHSHEVREKSPNNLGLYDMSGNISEWCQDWYFNSYANSKSRHNPQGPTTGSNKVYRGGSWDDKPINCRVSKRFNMNPKYKNKLVGIRLAASIQ